MNVTTHRLKEGGFQGRAKAKVMLAAAEVGKGWVFGGFFA